MRAVAIQPIPPVHRLTHNNKYEYEVFWYQEHSEFRNELGRALSGIGGSL